MLISLAVPMLISAKSVIPMFRVLVMITRKTMKRSFLSRYLSTGKLHVICTCFIDWEIGNTNSTNMYLKQQIRIAAQEAHEAHESFPQLHHQTNQSTESRENTATTVRATVLLLSSKNICCVIFVAKIRIV